MSSLDSILAKEFTSAQATEVHRNLRVLRSRIHPTYNFDSIAKVHYDAQASTVTVQVPQWYLTQSQNLFFLERGMKTREGEIATKSARLSKLTGYKPTFDERLLKLKLGLPETQIEYDKVTSDIAAQQKKIEETSAQLADLQEVHLGLKLAFDADRKKEPVIGEYHSHVVQVPRIIVQSKEPEVVVQNQSVPREKLSDRARVKRMALNAAATLIGIFGIYHYSSKVLETLAKPTETRVEKSVSPPQIFQSPSLEVYAGPLQSGPRVVSQDEYTNVMQPQNAKLYLNGLAMWTSDKKNTYFISNEQLRDNVGDFTIIHGETSYVRKFTDAVFVQDSKYHTTVVLNSNVTFSEQFEATYGINAEQVKNFVSVQILDTSADNLDLRKFQLNGRITATRVLPTSPVYPDLSTLSLRTTAGQILDLPLAPRIFTKNPQGFIILATDKDGDYIVPVMNDTNR